MIKRGLSIFLLFLFSAAHAQQVKLTDVLGKTVTLSRPAKKILLGEGRDIITLNIWADEAILLHNGKAYRHDQPGKVFTKETLKEAYHADADIAAVQHGYLQVVVKD